TEDSKSFDYEIEKRCCLVLLKYLSCAKYTAFGYEPILRYVFSKNNEIRNLRTIFVGKLHNLSSEEIKARIGPFDA
ncbi:MAG: V-type ATPase subunit, partial [Candidatus Omnitrophota bacterium]